MADDGTMVAQQGMPCVVSPLHVLYTLESPVDRARAVVSSDSVVSPLASGLSALHHGHGASAPNMGILGKSKANVQKLGAGGRLVSSHATSRHDAVACSENETTRPLVGRQQMGRDKVYNAGSKSAARQHDQSSRRQRGPSPRQAMTTRDPQASPFCSSLHFQLLGKRGARAENNKQHPRRAHPHQTHRHAHHRQGLAASRQQAGPRGWPRGARVGRILSRWIAEGH